MLVLIYQGSLSSYDSSMFRFSYLCEPTINLTATYNGTAILEEAACRPEKYKKRERIKLKRCVHSKPVNLVSAPTQPNQYSVHRIRGLRAHLWDRSK